MEDCDTQDEAQGHWGIQSRTGPTQSLFIIVPLFIIVLTEKCTFLCNVYCVLCIVYCLLYIVYCVLCIVYCVLCIVLAQ